MNYLSICRLSHSRQIYIILLRLLWYYFFMSTKKKILFVITKANWGGAQKYIFDLASEINDYEVVIAYGKPFGELNDKLKDLGIKTVKINNLKRNFNLINEFKVFRNLGRILKQEKPDILHLNSPKISGLGALLGRLCNTKKIIYTVHGWTFNEKRPFWQIQIIKFLSWMTIILSHKTIVISQKEYKQVIHWPFVTKNKLQLIYNGIKPIHFLSRNEAREGLVETFLRSKNVSAELLVGQEGLVIGTISELHRNKGLKYAIKGFRKIAEKNAGAKFIIIGEGEDREYLEKKIQEYNLKDKVFLVGHIEDASKYLKAFDIFLLSSLKEGLPFVLLEAGLAKLPVIATGVGGIPEIIENGQSGILIEEKEEDEIESALIKLVKDKNKRDLFGENLYKTINEKFSFKTMLEKTKQLY